MVDRVTCKAADRKAAFRAAAIDRQNADGALGRFHIGAIALVLDGLLRDDIDRLRRFPHRQVQAG